MTPPPLTSTTRSPNRSAVMLWQSALTVTCVASRAAHVVAEAATMLPVVSVRITITGCATRQGNGPVVDAARIAFGATGGGGGAFEPCSPQAASDAARDIIKPTRASSHARAREVSMFKLDTP